MFKTLSALFVVSLLFTGSEAITAYIYSSSTCSGSPIATQTYTLNVCNTNLKPIVCNTTSAQLEKYASSTCVGSPLSVIVAIPETCTSDGGSDYVKVYCTDPVTPGTKSSSSIHNVGLVFIVFALIVSFFI